MTIIAIAAILILFCGVLRGQFLLSEQITEFKYSEDRTYWQMENRDQDERHHEYKRFMLRRRNGRRIRPNDFTPTYRRRR